MQHTAPPSPSDAVRVEVLTPHEARAHLGDGTALAFLSRRGDAPRVRDVEFGAWLGFRDPRQIRQLIKSMVRTGKFNGSEILHAPRRNPEMPTAGRPADEVWLTREQALLVATQSGTPRAWAITRMMVRVFEAVLDATRAPAMDGEAMAKLLREALATEAARLRVEITAELRRELAANTVGDGVSLGTRTARVEVLLPVRALARRLAVVDRVFTRASHCARIHMELRDALGLPMHLAWALVPAGRLGEIRAALSVKARGVDEREARLRAAKAEKRQAELPLGKAN